MYLSQFANLHIYLSAYQSSGSSSFGRAIAFQAIGGEFEPRLPLSRRVGHNQPNRSD